MIAQLKEEFAPLWKDLRGLFGKSEPKPRTFIVVYQYQTVPGSAIWGVARTQATIPDPVTSETFSTLEKDFVQMNGHSAAIVIFFREEEYS